MENLDVEGLSKLLVLAKERNRSSSRKATLIRKVGRETALAPSFAQQRLWFLAQLDQGGTQYHVPLAWRLKGGLDRSAWQRSLDRVLARHEALRSVFVTSDGKLRVELLPEEAGLPVVEHDLRDRLDADAALSQLCQQEGRTPFDLARGPLIRGRLIRLSDETHVFLLTQHHIVSDGWSLGVLVGELSQLYRAFVAGDDDPLPPLAIQYPDYAAWQRQWLSGERLQRQAQYWRSNLSGAPARLALPTDRPRPAQQSFAGATVPIIIDADLTRGLKRLSRQHGTTLFMTVLAGWAAVLSRLSGQDDLVIGVPSANRGHREIEELIGFFVNTLALRLDLSGEPSVSELLERTRCTALGAQEHQDLPFEQVVEIVQPPRALDHTPLFQVMLAWENKTGGAFDLAGLMVEAAGGGYDQVKFDLELSLGEQGEEIAGTLAYATALFDQTTIERQRDYLLALLRAMAADAQQEVGRIELLSAAERTYLLEALNRTAAPYPAEQCIQELFEAQVRKAPEAVAVVYQDQRVSYGALNAHANQLAHHLIALGVKPDQPVAICVARSPLMVVGLLAILKAGGAYVPLDPAYPSARLRQVLEDAAPRLLLTDAAGRAALGDVGLDASVLELDAAAPAWASLPESDPDPRALGLTSRHLAYVIYTSGSTGTPKGVMVEHRSLVNLGLAQITLLGVCSNSRIVQFASFGFDASVWEIIMAFGSGAALHLPADELCQASTKLSDYLRSEAITHATLPPALLQQSKHVEYFASQALILAGELPKAELIRCLPAASIVNGYGPTETTVCATTWSCPAEFDEAIVPIGRPIANTRVYLLDGHGEPVPFGAVGELCIGGAGVARGYLNRPELTAERFIASPFVDGDRLYRTGDLARYLADGNLEFLGRNDEQVKIRGFRIEPGEIAARLLEHPAVGDAVVVAREDGRGEQRLVAYVVAPEAEESDLAGGLRAHLSARLPDYMVPSAFVRLARLPLTVNGKVDRNALPAPSEEAYAHRAYAPPQGEIETALATIWAELLGVERIGRHDNFFELGGHSLLAVQLMSRLSQAQGVELPLRTLFARPVLADLAMSIVEELNRCGPQELPAIVAVSRHEPLVLSFAQQRLWFLAQLDQGSTHYHVPLAWRLKGGLDRSAWQRSLDRVLARHEALRSVFVTSDGKLRVELLPEEAGLPVVEHDLRDRLDADAALSQLCQQEGRTPFDLARGPLIRGRLIRLSDETHVFLLTQHHIVSDGWSLGVLVGELSQLYRAFVAGDDDPLPPLAIQYPDYAAWQRQWLSGERLQRQAQYWRSNLSGAPARLALPTDRPRPAQQSFAGATVPIIIDADLTRGLKRLSRQHGTTLFMTVLAGWAAVLSRLSGQDDLVIGVPSANRGHREIEELIGFFVNTLALRLDLSGEPSVSELLERTRCTALGAQEHQDLPFEQVVEIVQPPRALDHTPLFQVMLAWENKTGGAFDLAGLMVEAAGGGYDQVKFDLELSLGEQGEEIAGTLAYATALFDQTTIERQRDYLLALLRAMAADAQQEVGRIELLSAAERTYLLEALNRTAAPYPAEQCIQELFEAQVRKAPEAVAVVYQDQRVSYGALNAHANQLAHHLIALGVKPDQPVAICVARSPLMVVGLLAILKAGGAYVPLDPAYPSARLRQVLEDAAPRLLLTDAAGRAALGDVGLDASVLELDAAAPAWASLPESDPDPRALGLTSRHLAYVIYTSGSTGTPKGVMVEHRSLVNYLSWARDAYAPRSSSVISSPLVFDATINSLFAPLICGGHAFLIKERDEVEGLKETVRSDCGIVNITPSHLNALGQQMLADSAPSRVGLLIIGGEALSHSTVELWRRIQPTVRMVNEYGPTEAVVGCIFYDIPREPSLPSNVPIGRPIANTRVYLLDGHGEPVPFGAVGELCIGGAGVARGYLNRPELTAERFIASPFVDGDRLYRTGDLARYLADGNLEFLGRNDEQVKIRGFRIEPGEIAARLLEHPAVGDAVVVAREDGRGEQRLVAYVVAPEAEESDLAGGLRAHLSARLPDYMVPSAFVRLARLPLTVNGKVDRNALPAPSEEAYAHRAYAPPQGEIETALATIWAELLGVERIGRHDNFFELGGHSLLAVQLMELLRRRSLGIEVRTLFAQPVLADLAASLGHHQEVAVPANLITERSAAITPQMLPLIELAQDEIDRIIATVPGGVDNIQDIYGLSPLQDGILFHHLLAAKGDPYLLVSQMAFAERGLLERYLAAVQRVVDRHDILRTSFVWEGLSQPAQVVWRKAQLEVTEVELDGAHGAGAEQLRERFDPRRHRIELGRAPLLRFVIAREPGSARWLLLELQHHLIGDHTTLDVMHAEVRAELEGRQHELPAPQPFRNLVAQVHLRGDAEADEAFFRELLADIDEPTTPFGLSEVRGDGGGVREAHRLLPPALHARLREQARRLGVSLASLCHLAWGQVVARSSGREQVVFGTVLFGRLQGNAGADRAMGLFINTLPLRLDLDGTAVEASVRTTHARLAELLAHEHASLALAQRCSAIAAPAPLFSALLNYRHNTAAVATATDDSLVGVEWLGGEERTNYPLTLSVEDFGEALGLTAQVAEPISADRICGYMQRALEQLAEALERAPDTPVRELDILPAAERTYLLEELNRTAAAYPAEQCIQELFEAQVRKAPEAVALVYQDQRVSYGALNAHANQLAHHLIALGVKPDQPVAICVARSPLMVVGLLAILKAGGAYVPLDPAYPSARLRQVLEDAAPRLLLTDAAGRAALGDVGLDASVLELDAAAPAWASLPESDPDPRALGLTSRHLAYVIYTSGSTGTPKGVMVEHAQIVRLFEATQEWYGFTEQDVWCLFHSFSFDFSVWELWGALRYGGRLILVPSDTARSAPDFDDLICKSGVTVLNQTPSAFKALVDLERQRGARNRLRYVIFGGEALEPSILKPWYARYSDRAPQLINMYGITETTVHVTYRSLDQSDTTDSGSQIGRRIPDLRIYLLDGHGEPVPFGAVGELCIGGAGVARGYLNRPELTAERFIASPFVDGDRLYRTGDLARYLADGNLEFLGRNDEQVKIRGFRIEPGEIAARLLEHPAVGDAVVVAREDGRGEQRLVAYVVAPEAEESDLAGGLRAHLSARLPDYMVPSAFVRLARLPLTVNGKVDRNALPAPSEEAYAHRAYAPPQGEIETALATIWAELLGVERIGRHDNFFELGGHSLLAVQLMSRLSQAQGVELPLRTLFARPVLADLAMSIVEELNRCGPQELPAIVAVSRHEPLVLSFAQQRLWFLAQLDQGSTHYHVPLAWRLKGGLDRSAWQRSLDRVLARHEALRSVFVTSDGKLRVELLPEEAGLPVVEHDLRDRLDADAALSQLCQQEGRTPFDLARGPLIRGRLIRLSDETHVFLLTQHHIVSDGWSLGVLVGELSQLYRAFVAGDDDPLPPLAIQYPDYAAWQRQWLSGERLQRQAQYWRSNLSGAPARLALPTDRPRPAQQSFAGATVPIIIDADLTRGLKRLSRQHGTTLFMTVLAGWAAVLSRLSGQDDLVIGVPSANRGHREIEELIGFFVNTLALRLDLSGEPSVSELLERTRCTALGAQEHQDLPFEQVVEIVQPPRALDHTPLFQVMLAWENKTGGAFDLAGLMVEAAGGGYDQVKFDLELSLGEQGEEIAGTLAYATALFDQTTIERQRDYLLALLRAMAADAQQEVGRIELLSAAERTYLLEALNRTAAPYPAEQCIQELFEAQVRKAPEAVAVVYQDQRVSYGALNAHANQLAHHLIALGVKPDQPVAICVARSPLMVVGLLAILKAGGAYVPLDPAYPSARLRQVLEDAAPRLLLTDAAGRAALGDVGLDASVLELDAAAPAWASLPESDPDPRALGLTSRHLAYVIYTSGSTGTPKGVMVEHRSLVNYLSWARDAYAPRSSSVISSPLVFDATINSLFAPLICGGHAFLIKERDEVEGLKETVRSDCGIVNITPSHLNALGQQMLADSAPSRVGLLIIGGEALSHSTVELWRRIQPTVRMVNEYGPTEAVVGCIFYDIPREPSLPSNVPIGRPIANTRVYLLDGHGEPVPFGAVGELCIGGAGVARGYLNRPELTAERFIASPFVDGDRLYRTGDLARYLADGNLEFLGRNDEQVKIRGFRIEPGEIAARLLEHPAVGDAVVVAREDGRGEQRLVAYVVAPEAEESDLAGGLRAHLSARLPDYMVPSAFVRLARLPLTVNGKVDRNALPAPSEEAYAHRAYAPPQGEIETALATIWAELLGVERIGRHDNFFELGGHSLLAVQLMELLRRRSLGIEVRTLFAQPVLADLAASLGHHQEVAVPANLITERSAAITPQMLPLIELAQDEIDRIIATVPGGVDNIQDIYGLSPLQDGILFHHLLAAKGDPYLLVSQMAFAERGLLERYLAAVQRVVDRHDILRTSFVWEGLSQPAQVVWRKAQLEVTEVELDGAHGAGAEQLRERFDPRRHRIELGRAPLLRFVIAREPGSARWLLLELQHHLIGDHTTLDVMHAEVRAELEGRQHELPAPQPFRNLVAQVHLRGDAEADEAFFRELLADIDEPTTPFGLSEVRGDGGGVREAHRLLPPALHARLREQARRLGVSLASLCHLAWGQVVARSSGREQVVFGTVLFGRLQGNAGADRAMGLFINTLPLRLDLDGTAVEASVRTTHARLAELLAHEHASLALAQRCSAIAAPAPLFSALLNYRHNTAAVATATDDSLVGVEWLGGEERTNYPLTLSVEDFGEALGLTAQVAEPISADRICGYMQRALEQLAEALERAPDTPVRELDILPAAERTYLLEELNRTAAAYPAEQCIQELFEAQVRKAPEAVALVYQDQRVSYGALNAHANQLAHHLIALGVKPDQPVAICVARSPLMVVGLLAILKAGGAYVPLDPAYPSARLRQVLEDAAPRLLLTDAAGRAALGDVGLDASVLELDAAAPAWASLPESDPDPRALGLTSRHLAYVIYTSGSTGTPKGVMVEHRSLVNLIIWHVQTFCRQPETCCALTAGVAFDASTWELWSALCNRSTLLLPPRASAADSLLLQWWRDQSPDIGFLITPLATIALEYKLVNSKVEYLLVGGDRLQRVPGSLAPNLKLINNYGPTEATVVATSGRLFAEDVVPHIGRPIANTRVYLLDGHGSRCRSGRWASSALAVRGWRGAT
ncbi:amino acid adenylation domain-containing protein [Bradyrhizobium japonicum]|uniref:amino acid adenylation domain-containing protein n=1 Tax=Bradyrhizobium japonicum TaxID=375 RepID=UPI003F74074F